MTATTPYRYERKFAVPALTPQAAEAIVKMNPAAFSEIYHERFVNNIYLDSFSLKNYFDRIDGANETVKVRIRWYDGLFGYIEKPALELKAKSGQLGRKEIFGLREFTFGNDFTFAKIQEMFYESDIPDVLKTCLTTMEFGLISRFRRKYFQSGDRNFRLTIDSEIRCGELKKHHNDSLNMAPASNAVVLELKYGREQDDSAGKITNFLPFRLTRNSKYINGVENLNLWLG